jgi:hypothetical protein
MVGGEEMYKPIKCAFIIKKRRDGTIIKCGKLIPQSWGNRKYCEEHSIESRRRSMKKACDKWRAKKIMEQNAIKYNEKRTKLIGGVNPSLQGGVPNGGKTATETIQDRNS